MADPLLQVDNLSVHFPVTRGVWGKAVGHVRAVDGVSFAIYPGETLGLVGESGCGKSTVGRSVLSLLRATNGRVRFLGQDLAQVGAREMRELRRQMQIIFQDPFSSLNPRMRIEDIIGEPLRVHRLALGAENQAAVQALLEKVGVPSAAMSRYPHEFSGGQRQRIGIARALALRPKLIVCDEAVSALDVSIRAQVLNLLIQLRKELGLAYLFISHDLSVVRHISDRVMVMYLGEIVEVSPTEELFEVAAHPYTRALFSAIPVPDPRHRGRRMVLDGDVPSPLTPPAGCRFHTRCPVVMERCSKEAPPLVQLTSKRLVRCFHAEEQRELPLSQLDKHLAQLEGRAQANRQSVRSAALGSVLDEQRRSQAHTIAAASQASEPLDAIAAGDRTEPNQEPSALRHDATEINWVPSAGQLQASLALAGSVLVALGNFWALSLVILGYLWARLDGRLSHKTRLMYGCLVLIILPLGFGSQRQERVALAQEDLLFLRSELEDYQHVTGQFPPQLDELGYRLGFRFHGQALDPWGTPYRYSPPQAEGAYQLSSFGPDAVPSTDDLD